MPVTLIQAGPCTVVQKKTAEKDGYEAIQLGYENVPERKLTKPEIGHQKKAGLTEFVKVLKEFPLEDCSKFEVGDQLTANLFAAGDLSKDVSPLKFYEYLATGKPIVSTPQPEQVLQFKDLIHIAPTAEDFVRCCREALLEHDTDLREGRLEAGRRSSWDARVAQMREILTRRGIFPEGT